jgi:uncharacterized protein (TIGR02466 family)
MAAVEIHVQGLFATPVAAIMLPGFEERNAALSEIVLSRRQTHPSIEASNNGGWHSSRDFAAWGGPYGEELLAKARSAVNQLTVDREGKSVKPDWTVEAWANVNDANSSNACHYHPGSFWSASYYVADGGCADDPTLGGEFEMFDPRGPAPMMHAPSLKFAGEGGLSAGSGETIRPRPGLLFLFPSFLLHAVRPYRGTGLRISIAINFGLYPKAIPRERN